MELEFMKIQILGIGLLILGAYGGGMIAKKLNIGETIGQILGGMFIGPHLWAVIYNLLAANEVFNKTERFKSITEFYHGGFHEYSFVLEELHYFVFFFLGVIAFSLGEELHLDRLKKVGIKAALISVIQALFTWLLLFLGFRFIFKFEPVNALIVGSIGIATAPALTFVLMNKLKIEGKIKNVLANIVVLDDIIEVIFFSIFLGVAVMLQHGEKLSFGHLAFEVVKELGLAVLVGILIFLMLKFTVKPSRANEDERLMESFDSFHGPMPSIEMFFIIVGFVAIGSAIALHFDLPFLVVAVVAGALVANFHYHAIFDALKLSNIMPALNLVFFAIIGASVSIETFSKETLVYVLGYLALRGFGKFAGTWIGAKATKQEPEITNSLPKLMLPQAGMAAVETILVATILKGHGGEQIFNTIIPALVIFELGGAWLSEKTLVKWKEKHQKRKQNKLGAEEELLREIIRERVFDLKVKTREEAIQKLTQVLVDDHIITDEHEVVHAVLAREKVQSTALGEGVAIPHCRDEHVQKTVSVCGILKKGIEWDTPDDKDVEIVFLVVTPRDDPGQYLKAVRAIVKTLKELRVDGDISTEIVKKYFIHHKV